MLIYIINVELILTCNVYLSSPSVCGIFPRFICCVHVYTSVYPVASIAKHR